MTGETAGEVHEVPMGEVLSEAIQQVVDRYRSANGLAPDARVVLMAPVAAPSEAFQIDANTEVKMYLPEVHRSIMYLFEPGAQAELVDNRLTVARARWRRR